MYIKIFLFLTVSNLLLIMCTYGQKNYNISISIVHNNTTVENLEINCIDGNNIRPIGLNKQWAANENIVANFKNPVIEFHYKSKSNKNNFLRFFITNFKSNLIIRYDSIEDSIYFEKGYGIIDFAISGEEDFKRLAQKELLNLELLERKANYHIDASDTLTLNKLTVYINELRDKKVKYIRNNPKSKYSLWLFIDDILGNDRYSSDYQNQLYKKYLQSSYKNTFEDKFILEKLDKYRLSINTVAPYIDVPFKDLEGVTYRFKDFNGKYVLVILWATWCVPCVEEIPTLKEMYLKHFNDIEFVSFSTDRDKAVFNRFVESRKIPWHNIFGRYDFTQTYGANKSIPQLYLLDKKSKIIYSQTFYNDYDLSKLRMLINKITVAK